MATAKRLPSGSYRAQVFDYTDDAGKRHYKSFTANTKKEAEYMAAEYAMDKKHSTEIAAQSQYASITFKDAREKYIDLKKSVLSPSTIRGYYYMKSCFPDLDPIRMDRISNYNIQAWINKFSTNHSTKSVKNAYGFISCIYKEFLPEVSFHVTLPKGKKKEFIVPTDADIKRIIDYFSQYDTNMLYATYLAAFGTLRRSEVCGLTADDISGNVIHVRNTMVKDKDGNKVLKHTTKTAESDRYIDLPQFVIDALPADGIIVNLTPDALTRRFQRALIKLKMPPYRFHDLRHYSASIMHAMGVPDQYIMKRGGWSSDRILKDIYRGTVADYEQRFVSMTNTYFENMQHENKKTAK